MEAFGRRRVKISFRDRSVHASAIGRPAIIASSRDASNGILRAFFRNARHVRISIVNKLIRRRRVAFLLRTRHRVRTITFAAKGRPARLFLINAKRIGAKRVNTYVGITPSRTGRVISTKGSLVCTLIKISVLILLIRMNGLCNLPRLRFTFIYLFRSRSGARGHDLANAIETSSARSAIK